MSNLNNFWNDCIEDDYSDLKENIHSSSNSNRTKPSTRMTTSSHKFRPIIYHIRSHMLAKNKNKGNKIIGSYTNNTQKNILSQNSIIKNEIEIQNNNNIIINKLYTKKTKRKKSIINSCYNSRNKSKFNNNSEITSMEIKLRKNLSECTFHPKLISKIKNEKLKEKLFNYSKFTMYERGQIFEMKKKEDNNRMYIEEYKRKNKKYSFKPKINKCPSFKKVTFNEFNYNILNNYYSRMNSAREYKAYKKTKMPFEMCCDNEYIENNKNNNNYCINNNVKSLCGKKNRIRKRFNKLSPSLLLNRIICDKESKISKQNLHKILMNLQLSKDE